jgi:hypothetical protein
MLVDIYSPADGWYGSFVKYEKSKSTISILFSSQNEMPMPERQPSMYDRVYKEYFDGEFNGEYIISSQGAVIYNLVYKGKNGKEVQFKISEDADLQGEPGVCVWPNK